jgi:outer membrane putative beta-barrel porin/alpha-amylase
MPLILDDASSSGGDFIGWTVARAPGAPTYGPILNRRSNGFHDFRGQFRPSASRSGMKSMRRNRNRSDSASQHFNTCPSVFRLRCAYALALFAVLAGAHPERTQSQVARQASSPPSDSTGLINPDRPGIADGSRVILPTQLQLEIGLQHERRRAGGDVRKATTFVPILIRFGIAERIEARVEGNSLTSTRTSGADSPSTRVTGYSPLSVGAKYQIYDSHGENRRSFGLIGRVFLPTGSSDFRNDRYTGDIRFAADWDFAPMLSLNPNLGVARQEDGQGRTFVATLSALTLNYSPTERINPFVDVGTQAPEAPGGAAAVVLDGGLAYIIGRDLQLDVSAGRGVHGSTPPRPFIAVGLSVRRRR